MKALAINGRFLGQPISGVQRYARELIRGLDKVLTYTPRGVRPSVKLLAPPDVPAAALPSGLQFVKTEQAGRFTGHRWEQLELPRLASDAVLISLTNSAPLLHPRQVVAIHDAAIRAYPADYTWAYRAWYRSLYAGLRRTRAHFISVSGFAATEVSQRFGIPASRITVVPNAAEHFLQLPSDSSSLDGLNLPGPGYVLAVGGQAQRKNLALVEQALAGLEDCPPLVVAGGGASRAFTSNAARFSSAVFLDHVSDAAIKALYQGALCLVFPSRYEGFGLPPLEAMACMCPVITARTASMPEVCGDAALYCDPDSPETLAAHIRRLMTTPALRNDLIARGAERVRHYSWEGSGRKLLDLATTAAFTPSAIPDGLRAKGRQKSA